MKFQVGDLFVYSDSRTPTTLLLLIEIRLGTLYLEFLDEEGVYIRGQYNAEMMTNNYLKDGHWKHFPVKI